MRKCANFKLLQMDFLINNQCLKDEVDVLCKINQNMNRECVNEILYASVL